MELSEDDQKLFRAGLWEALREVKDEKPGAMRGVETLFTLALAGDREQLLRAMQGYADEREG
jgi:hypothetical protein